MDVNGTPHLRPKNDDNERTIRNILNLHAGQMYHENFSFFVTILSVKNGRVLVSESSYHNKEGDEIEYISIEQFKKEYSFAKDKYWIEYLNDVTLEPYWENKNLEMDCA
jgi:hypothetical protein